MSGRTVLEQNFDLVTDLTLNLENLSAGVYMVEIQGAISTKIVKVSKN